MNHYAKNSTPPDGRLPGFSRSSHTTVYRNSGLNSPFSSQSRVFAIVSCLVVIVGLFLFMSAPSEKASAQERKAKEATKPSNDFVTTSTEPPDTDQSSPAFVSCTFTEPSFGGSAAFTCTQLQTTIHKEKIDEQTSAHLIEVYALEHDSNNTYLYVRTGISGSTNRIMSINVDNYVLTNIESDQPIDSIRNLAQQ